MPQTEFYNIADFIKDHIRFGQHWNTKRIDMVKAKWQVLGNNTWIGGCEYAKGSEYKVFETTNFGWVVFRQDTTKTPDGNIPGRFIHRW